ncbi:glycosyltransferase [Salinivibrio socompensis]|uniref:glycosyltransferase n=1 Tax=Salinivibrio socompensis TaxID=1510206 RepID=UPI0004728CEB|nr:glycosyltransferase [Salinivibrio socompensis]
MKQCAQDFGVADRVDFEGFQTNMIPYYLHARGTLLTSLYEGFPNVLIESIILGTPVVAFDCPSGPREIIQEGVNGYLVDHLSVDDLQKVCRISLKKPLAREAVQASAYKYFCSDVITNYEAILTALE